MNISLLKEEIYLQQDTQYQGSKPSGIGEEENMFKGVMTFIINSLKSCIHFIVESVPEIKIQDVLLSQKIDKYIDLLHDSDFNIIFVKCDNHSTNATAFNLFLKKCLSKTSAHGNFWKYSSNSGYGIHLFFILYIYLKI